MKRGRMIYAPKSFIELMEQVKLDRGIESNITAFEEIKNWTLVGREVEKLNSFGRIKKKGGWI